MQVQQAFDQMKIPLGMQDCELEIEVQILLAVCLECETVFEVFNFDFHCPTCRSSSVRITQGDEVKLVSLAVEDTLT